mmetsp:Transcript_21966/g.24685  ORF Transcript_21966/g.24685 Transcript_21966/m.24685 type:complete len:258 (-) Transcript_21966:209-982(-)
MSSNRNSNDNNNNNGYKTEIVVTEVTPILDENYDELSSTINTRTGRWKSGLCSCCQYGCFHPAFCCAWFFPMALMGQVLTRMQRTWYGTRSTPPSEEYKKTFGIVVTIWICYILLCSVLYCPPTPIDYHDDVVDDDTDPDCPVWKQLVFNTLTSVFGLYTLIVMIRLRRAIRTKYNIPEGCCLGCEDCCCIFFCGCLSSIQMAHQTANYEEVGQAMCCNSTGLLPPTTIPTAYHYNNDNGNVNANDNKSTLTKAVVV